MAVPRPFVALVLALAVAVVAAGCDPEADNRPPAGNSRDAHIKEPQVIEPAANPEPEPEPESEPELLDYDAANDVLDAAVGPSNTTIDSWNAAVQAEDWPQVRALSAELTGSLATLQTDLRAAAWPADVADLAETFAAALDDEIAWYAVVAAAADDDATIAAVDSPWSAAAVEASDALWAALEDRLYG